MTYRSLVMLLYFQNPIGIVSSFGLSGCFLNAIGPSFFADAFIGGSVQSVRVLVGAQNVDKSFRQVDFCIQDLQKDGLNITFKDRLLTLDPNSDCKIKVNLLARVSLYGVKSFELDTLNWNGDPSKSDEQEIDLAYSSVLDQLVNPRINNVSLSASDYPHPDHKTKMDKKRKNIIDAIKEVCEKCCCRMEEQYCVKPSDISQAVKDVCKDCCCKNKDPCVNHEDIINAVKGMCLDCCCKKPDCCGTKEVEESLNKFACCVLREVQSYVEGQKGTNGCQNSTCKTECCNYSRVTSQIAELCPSSDLKTMVQTCINCNGGHSTGKCCCGNSNQCKCCKTVSEALDDCKCKACTILKKLNDEITQCCPNQACCQGDADKCVKASKIYETVMEVCECKDQVKQIKEKINGLCQSCKSKKCCDTGKIESQIKSICEQCDCKQRKCCNEDEIQSNVKKNGTISNKAEKEKLKNIAKAIFKYFRPPSAYKTGLMTLESTTETELEFSSSSSNDKITVDSKNNNVLKIPKQALKDLIACTKIHSNIVTAFHKNTMLSIHFEEISLTFQKLNGTGFEIDGYPINGTFLMQLEYKPAGLYTKNTANWRKKVGKDSNEKHNLSWSIDNHYPRIDKNKCSCSILSDPLFGTVFGAICLTISIVQFIIALFVSQGYYDGFQSYMDAVRSGFSWPTQYDNVASSIFWWLWIGVRNGSQLLLVCCGMLLAYSFSYYVFPHAHVFGNLLILMLMFSHQYVNTVGISISPSLGTYEAVRNVEFCIEQIGDLTVNFENRVLSLDSGSDCKLKVGLHAKIVLYGVKWFEPDTMKWNGGGSDDSVVDDAYSSTLGQLISPSIGGKSINTDSTQINTMDEKRLNIINAIKEVCKDCCCNRKEDEYCIQPTDISQAVKEVCANCCCKNKDPCVDSSKIMDEVGKLCVNCCCKKEDCCGTKEVLSQIEDFCVCLIKDAKGRLENCKCENCSDCQENCIDKQKLMTEILKLCSCDKAKKELEQAAQNCDSCKGSGSGSCQCCEAVQKKFKDCPCMACDLKRVIENLQGSGENGSNCCDSSSCPCSSGSNSNCRKKTDVLKALNAYCKCKDQVKEIKKKINGLCKQCNKNTCCDISEIQSDIQKLCNSCPCKTHPTCCNEDEIKSKVETVIQTKCTCKKKVCCFNKVTDGDLKNGKHSAEQSKLKEIALAIFKYFRPPIAHSTGVMTLKSTADIDLQFSSGSSSSQDNITVDAKNKNVLKIPKQAFKDLIASTKINQVKVDSFHRNTMLSIHFEEISLTFQKLNGTGFEIDGFPVNGCFSMQLGYKPEGIFTRSTALWRKKTGSGKDEKHNLSWSIDNHYPQIDPSKCSCSIESDPLFGTVFGAICLTISIVQFIIALFVSQGYYDGFQSYMDAVRSGFSWPTQYDNVASSMFWWFGLGVRNGSRLLLVHINTYDNIRTYEAVRVLVGSSGSQRQVEFCIEQIGDLSVKFENRVLSLDPNVSCKLKVSLHAKINLVGVKWFEPDTLNWNGGGSDNSVVDSAYSSVLDQLVNPRINNVSLSGQNKTVMDQKRMNIIKAIKKVCESCCCNRAAEQYCIQPTDISEAVKQVCAQCCCKSKDPCVDSSKIMEHVNKLCQNCCCKQKDCCNTEGVLSQIEDFCVCVIKEAKGRLDECTCDSCSSCQEHCIDKQKLMTEILKLCSCSEAKKELEQAPQKCDSCQSSSSGTCQCCQEAKNVFKDCSCMACDLKRVIDGLNGSNGSNNCCDNASCSCSDPNCRTKDAVLTALKTYCKCTDHRNELKEKINGLCKQCKDKKCCDVKRIQSEIEKLCNSCPCKTHPKCCQPDQIEKNVKTVIESKCTCKKQVCCFNKVTDANQSLNSDEQNKLKEIALAIFKYFRPPSAYKTGLMTLKSTKDIDLEFSFSDSNKITVDPQGNGNALKIPKQALKDLIACTKIHSNIVTAFHKNTMLSIHFEEISLTFQKLNGTGFEIDGYPINGTFLMQLEYKPAGLYTKNTANWRKKVGKDSNEKHNLSWSIDNHYPRIDKNKCSCSILSDPLFGTVFGAICLTISIVQFIIALFVSQGYYDGFQSYMDAVRSGFSWPTQYDNVASSIFWHLLVYAAVPLVGISSLPTLGTYAAVRNVEFWIEQLKDGLTVTFKDRLLSLDSGSDCKLKVSLHAKINLVGSRFSEPDTTKDNGDPDKNGSDSEITDIDNSYQKMLDDLVNFSSSDQSKVNTMNAKRKNIIDAIKDVCKDCSCGSNCCFRDVDTGDLSGKTTEKEKLKKIALAIFKYFRPPIAYETGVMTLESTTETELEFSSSGGDANITVDKGNGNVLKIPKQAFKDLIASTKINQDKVKDFHPNSMMSIKFEEICLTFQEFTGTGFCIDGYSINGSFSMQLGYLPAGIFTRNSANWRKKTGSKPNEKHDLSWSIGQPLIDPSKCSCSILSDPLFGTVFGAICISISIVQFIIALFVSQGYYDGFQSYMDAVRSGFSWPTQYDNGVSSIFWEVNFSIQELNNDIEIQFDNRVLSLPANSSCSIQVSLEAKIGLVGVKKPVADVDEENGNGLESGFEDVISSVLKELIEPTLNGSQEGKSKMNSKRLNIINAIKEVCKSCCCYKNRECLEASDISLAVTQFCKDCCSKDPKCCNTDDVLKQLKDFCVCPVKEIMEKNFENTQCKDVCKCHEKSTCCSKAVIEAFLYDLCPFKEARSVLHICPEHKSNEETCCGNGKNCKCTQKVKDKLALCGCKFCKIKKDLNEGFFNSEENKCQDCSGHECYLKDKFLQWLKKHCDCKVNREDITQAIQALSEKCKGKTCCNSEEIKTAVQSVITEKCQCTKMNCCFKNISNGDDLAVEKEDKANEKDILKNIAKEIFNYYKPPEPKTTGFIVLNSCKSKTLTLCSNNDGNGEKSNEHICVSSDNLKIYNEAFKDLKAFTKISSAYVSEFHPNSKIMIAFQSVTLKFCDFCSNGNEGFKIDGFPVNQRFSMTIQYRSPTPFLDKAANWKNISNDSDTKEEHHALTYNSFHSTGPLMDTFNCSCSVPCDSFLGSSCGSECFAVSTMYLFIALFISHGYYIGFQSYLDAVQSGFSWPTQFDDAIKSIFWWTFLALRNGFKLFFGMYNMDILGVVC
ncbi:hypothetical protein BdWA1_002860 [Babesia duncani]|uniref:Uncharacterized protein n=1 Tax=Babesia duncani TaxID=323732 RepID=A0AAD9PHY6_9APIC|nr:hypothetical protein BdWA1_002860 [Babesia duncani]